MEILLAGLKKKCIASALLSLACCCYSFSSLNADIANTAAAHMLIGDHAAAIQLLQLAISSDPKNFALWHILLQAKAAESVGDERLIALWQQMDRLFPQKARQDEVLESLCWGIIASNFASTAPQQRFLAMLAAALSRDAKSIEYLLKGFVDSNCIIRATAAQLAATMRDAPLSDGMLQAIGKEKNSEVRRIFLRTVSQQKLRAAEPLLWQIINDSKSPLEEKLIAIEAFVALHGSVERKILLQLVKSNRAALRLLACKAIAYEPQGNEDLLFALVDDPQGVVRTAAFQALALLRIPNAKADAIRHLSDVDVEAATAAAWLLLLQDEQQGQAFLRSSLLSSEYKRRNVACAAIASAGSHALSLICQLLPQVSDPFIRINLAFALILQRAELPMAGTILSEAFKEKSLWKWQEYGCWRAIEKNQGAPSKEAITTSSAAVDQMTRLELLTLLAVIEHPQALQTTREFLSSYNWGVAGTAAALLLTEGGEQMSTVVQKLMEDKEANIAVQAAIILGLWGHDDTAFDALQKAYPKASRELKEHILEAMGAIATRPKAESLIPCLQEPFPMLRLMAAAAILQALYR